jgi:hypothetical protein
MQQAMDRSEVVAVQVRDIVGTVRRPNLLGSLVVKAAAYSVASDTRRERHVIDFAVLGAMITRADRIDEKVTRRDRTYLNNKVDAAPGRREGRSR